MPGAVRACRAFPNPVIDPHVVVVLRADVRADPPDWLRHADPHRFRRGRVVLRRVKLRRYVREVGQLLVSSVCHMTSFPSQDPQLTHG